MKREWEWGWGKDLINGVAKTCECEGGKVYLYYSWLGAIASGLSTDMPFP